MSPSGRSWSLIGAARRLLAGADDPLDAALGLEFRPLEGGAHHDAWRRFGEAVTRTGLPRQIVAYVHVPFCRTICSFCALAVEPAPAPELLTAYVDGLLREAARWRETLGALEVSTVHLGGGTPSLLSARQLDRLLAGLVEHLPLRPDVEWGVELLPSSTTADKLRALVEHGVRRVSFGMQSVDPSVLRRAHRAYQSRADVQRAVEFAHRAGIEDVNVDVLVGLPGETDAAVEATIRAALALETRSMSLNRNLAENSPLSAHGWIPSRAATKRTTERLRRADAIVRELRPPVQPRDPVADPGYGVQYVWADEDQARAYFQDDMNGPASVLPLGHGATGHLHGMMYVIPAGTWRQWLERAGAGRPHDVLAARLTTRQEMAAFVARGVSRGRCRDAAFERVFGVSLEAAMGRRLSALAAEGVVTRAPDGWSPVDGTRTRYLELLTALGQPLDRLRAAAAPTRTAAAAVRGPAPARLPRVGGGEADVVDTPGAPARAMADAIAEARGAGATHVTLWTTPDRLEAAATRRRLEAAPPDLMMLALDEHGASGSWRPTARWAADLCPVGLFVAWSGARPAADLADLVDALALAGAPRILIELAEPLPFEIALRLWRHGARGRPELAVVFRDAATPWRQYADIDTPIPDSIVISRIAFRAARENRMRDGALARFQRRFGRPLPPRRRTDPEAPR